MTLFHKAFLRDLARKACLALAVCEVLACVAQASEFPVKETKEFPASGLKVLDVQNRSGFIKITNGAGKNATVEITKNEWAPTCVLVLKRDGERLVVRVEQSGIVDSDDCRADVEIRAPKHVNLEVAEGTGHVDVQGLEGQLKVKLEGGKFKADGHFNSVSASCGK